MTDHPPGPPTPEPIEPIEPMDAHSARVPSSDAAPDDQAAQLEAEAVLERADLDGHTMEELGDYLDRGRTPVIHSIETSPACQQAMADMVRLQEISRTALEVEAAREPIRDDNWVTRIMDLISIDAQAGRDIPYADSVERSSGRSAVVVTEGAIRGIVRSAGDLFDGILLGRCRLEGDVTIPREPIRIVVDASVFWGTNIPELVDAVREEILVALLLHTELNVTAVDVIVYDLQFREREDPEETR